METDYALKDALDLVPDVDSDTDLLDFVIRYTRFIGYDYEDPNVIAGLLSKMKIGR